MICLTNVETDETKTMTIDQFMEWFNDDCTGYISSVWSILWVQYEHPLADANAMGTETI